MFSFRPSMLKFAFFFLIELTYPVLLCFVHYQHLVFAVELFGRTRYHLCDFPSNSCFYEILMKI